MNVTALDSDKYLQKYTTLIKELLGETDEKYIKIGYHLLDLKEVTRYHIKAGYDDIVHYSEENFKLKKSTIYNFINIIKTFAEKDEKGNYKQVLKKEYEDYNYSQLRTLLSIPQDLHNKFNPNMSVRHMEQLKKELLDKLKDTEEKEPDLSIETDEDIQEDYKKLYEELLEEYQKQSEEMSKLMEIHKKYLKLFRESKKFKIINDKKVAYEYKILKAQSILQNLSSKLVINKKLNINDTIQQVIEELKI